jgi:hypothetical protein
MYLNIKNVNFFLPIYLFNSIRDIAFGNFIIFSNSDFIVRVFSNLLKSEIIKCFFLSPLIKNWV